MKKKIAAAIIAIVVTVAGLYFAGIIHLGNSKSSVAGADSKARELPPVYLTLDPPFVVNFTHRGTLRYLQVSLELTYHDPSLFSKVTERMPAIRNDLILLFSNQDYENLSTAAGKEQLRHEIFRAINHVIGIDPTPVPTQVLGLEITAPPAPPVEASAPTTPAATAAADKDKGKDKEKIDPDSLGEVYITNFVMQ